MGQDHQDEIEIDLKDLFFEMLNHWKILLASTIMTAAIALVVSKFIMIPQYESTAALYVLSNSITSLADIQIGSNLTNDYMVVVKGRPVLEQVIKNLNLDEDYQQLDHKITLNNPTDSRILEITVKDADPDRAKEIADEMAVVASDYISIKMDQSPPTTIQNGYADGNPVSPHVGTNTVLGALAGFLLAGAVIVVLYLMNDTIMTAEDVERKLEMNLLGSLPEEVHEDDGAKIKKTNKEKKKVKQRNMKKQPGKMKSA
ncbi:capsular biosynthesis protein [Lachnospiraceae bacterium]|nr:Wzz/FepE/Etk N-terminal domain-containing protein [uncultured Schaedlerella sp.]MCI9152234.1 capsular biosynthesis protein [Ruminococcus sp.]NBI58000.1 capsular biosynthesis protein [Lachnospiraceae bacterium]